MLDNENIIIKEYKGLKYLQYKKLLDLGIKHAYTLKSEGFDFSFGVDAQTRSYDMLAEALEIDRDTILEPVQTHTKKVLCIDKVENDLDNVDGLITDKPNLALTTKNADCILFLFYDPVKKVIANVHSGWKGTFQKISEVTIIKMISDYGCDPKDILVFISPSIRKCHFEVEEDVKSLCEETFKFMNKTESFIELGENKDGIQKYNIDTVLINKLLFKELGLKDENIIDCNICSFCHQNEVHSARAEGKGFNRGTAIITL